MIYSNLMTAGMNLEADIDAKYQARRGESFLPLYECNVTFGAVARPLNDILIEAEAPFIIDLLSLDVEGAEKEVLKGIDHQKFRFKYICIECRNISKMEECLGSIGYRLKEKLTHHDYLFEDIGLEKTSL